MLVSIVLYFIVPGSNTSIYPLHALPLANSSFYMRTENFLHKLHEIKAIKSTVYLGFQFYDQIHLWEENSQEVSVIPSWSVNGSHLSDKVADLCLMCVPHFYHPHTN